MSKRAWNCVYAFLSALVLVLVAELFGKSVSYGEGVIFSLCNLISLSVWDLADDLKNK